MKKLSYKENDGKDLTLFQNARNGAVAGSIGLILIKYEGIIFCLAGFLTTPVDVAKTKLMTQRDGYYKNLFDCLNKVAREEGFGSLFKAAHIRVFNITFGGMVFFSSYEFVRKHLHKKTLF